MPHSSLSTSHFVPEACKSTSSAISGLVLWCQLDWNVHILIIRRPFLVSLSSLYPSPTPPTHVTVIIAVPPQESLGIASASARSVLPNLFLNNHLSCHHGLLLSSSFSSTPPYCAADAAISSSSLSLVIITSHRAFTFPPTPSSRVYSSNECVTQPCCVWPT